MDKVWANWAHHICKIIITDFMQVLEPNRSANQTRGAGDDKTNLRGNVAGRDVGGFGRASLCGRSGGRQSARLGRRIIGAFVTGAARSPGRDITPQRLIVGLSAPRAAPLRICRRGAAAKI